MPADLAASPRRPRERWQSTDCHCFQDALTIEVGDTTGYFSYTVDPSQLPVPLQGPAVVMCQINEYLEGQPGMNIGGILFLFFSVLITRINGSA